MNSPTTKKCLRCGTEFTTLFEFQKYCNSNCTHNLSKKQQPFNIVLFDLQTQEQQTIKTTQAFIKKYQSSCQPNSPESAIMFYFKEQGYDVEDCTNSLIDGHSDLIIKKRKEIFVEVKGFNDSLRFNQFVFLFEKLKTNKVIVAYVVPKMLWNK